MFESHFCHHVRYELLFTCSIQEYILGVPSSKNAVQSVNLVEKIIDQKMRERGG